MIFGGGTQKRGAIFKGEDHPNNKVFDSTHKKNIKKTREAITPIVDAVKFCASKHSIERSQQPQKMIQK